VPEVEHPDVKPELEPKTRPGAEDPFNPVDPEDPFRVAPVLSPDPYVPADSGTPPTTNGGVIDPPPFPRPVPADPPGRVKLRQGIAAAQAAIPTTLPKRDPNLQVIIKAEGANKLAVLVAEGRSALGDHWQLQMNLAAARLDGLLDPTDTGDQSQLQTVRSAISARAALVDTLNEWSQARDATPPNESRLADLIGKAQEEIAAFCGDLAQFESLSLAERSAKLSLEMIAFSASILSHLCADGADVAAGQSTQRAARSDVILSGLRAQTPDQNLLTRIREVKTWSGVGKTLEKMIGPNLLDPVPANAKTAQQLNWAGVEPHLASLDQLLSQRAKATGPLDYSDRTDLLQAYTATIDALSSKQKLLRDYKPVAGDSWTAGRAQDAADIINAALRRVQSELAADPLTVDPDLAGSVRNIIAIVDRMADRNSIEVEADALGPDLRAAWKKAKYKQLAALREQRIDTKALEQSLDGGLGPSLDKLAAEMKRFPKQDVQRVKAAATDIAVQIARYRNVIRDFIGASGSSELVRGLDTIAIAVARRIASFDARGGLV
jgi:hypothetical protein